MEIVLRDRKHKYNFLPLHIWDPPRRRMLIVVFCRTNEIALRKSIVCVLAVVVVVVVAIVAGVACRVVGLDMTSCVVNGGGWIELFCLATFQNERYFFMLQKPIRRKHVPATWTNSRTKVGSNSHRPYVSSYDD